MLIELITAFLCLSESQWRQCAILNAPERMLPLGIGSGLVASDEGIIVVGAGRDRDTGADAGAVAIWRRHGSEIAIEAVIPHPRGSFTAGFGTAVAIGDGSRFVCIGAPLESGPGDWPENFQFGKVHLLESSAETSWDYSSELVSSVPDIGAHFGAALATDGTRIVVGSPDHDRAASFCGLVEVFVMTRGQWQLEAQILPPEIDPGMRFGTSVAINGNTIAVGSPGFHHAGLSSGRADVFTLVGAEWIHAAALVPPGNSPGDAFGAALSLRGDRLAIGAPGTDSSAGAVHIYDRQDAGSLAGTTEGTWRLSSSIFADESLCSNPTVHPEGFGCSVVLGKSLLAIGASESANPVAADSEHPIGEGSGAVYLFEQSTQASAYGPWKCAQRLVAKTAQADAHDGWAIALTQSELPLLVVGRLGNPDLAPGPGCVSVYQPRPSARGLSP